MNSHGMAGLSQRSAIFHPEIGTRSRLPRSRSIAGLPLPNVSRGRASLESVYVGTKLAMNSHGMAGFLRRTTVIHPEFEIRSRMPSVVTTRAMSGNNPTAVIEEELEETKSMVEVGYIASTHGLRGELHVHSLTDFPEERFEKPGVRWLRSRSMGRPSFQQVELSKGRIGPGKRPSWLITLKGVNSSEKASEFVGSTMLVAEEKSPSLHQDEFYVPELVGMRVVLQESREDIGVILDLYSTGGGNDLLEVQLQSPMGESGGRKVWIPFVKDIVPVVDKMLRRIEICPPVGLLELNAPADKEAKENRKQDLKENRKLRGILVGLKKRLKAMRQTHVLSSLSSGNKDKKEALLQQLQSIDFGVLQQVLQEILPPSDSLVDNSTYPPEPPPAFPSASWQQFEKWMITPSSSANDGDSSEEAADMARWWRKGLQLIADGRVAVVVLAGGQSARLGHTAPLVKGMIDLGFASGKSLFHLQAERLLLVQELASLVMESEFTPFIPWIIMTSDATDTTTRKYFEDRKFFGLDESQVWFMKQDSMPCVSLQSSEGHHEILMETPWKIAQAPNGNGGLFSALCSEGMLDRLIEDGIDYVQVYSVDNALIRVADPVFFGYTYERDADIGVKVVNKVVPEESVGVMCLRREKTVESGVSGRSTSIDMETSTSHYGVLEYSEMPEDLRYAWEETSESERSQHMNSSQGTQTSISVDRQLKFRAAHICVNIFSVDFLKRLGDSEFEFKFHTSLKRIPHVKKTDETWADVVPEKPNGMKLELFVSDAFKFCDQDKVALLEVCRDEEFAPVKNAVGSGLADSVDTARDLVLALKKRLMSFNCSKVEPPETNLARELLVAYLGGDVDKDVLELLGCSKDL